MMFFGAMKLFGSFISKLTESIGLYHPHDLHPWTTEWDQRTFQYLTTLDQEIELSGMLSSWGVHINIQLNFTDHINHMLDRASMDINALNMSASGRKAEERHLVMFYKTVVLTVVD